MRSTTKSTHVTAVIYRLRGRTPEIDRIYRYETETRRRDKFLRLRDSAINISVDTDVRRFAFHVVPSLFSSAPFATAHITETRKRLRI